MTTNVERLHETHEAMGRVEKLAARLFGADFLNAIWTSKETIPAREANADLFARTIFDTKLEQFDDAGKKMLDSKGQPALWRLRDFLAHYRAGLNNVYQLEKSNEVKLDKIITHLGIDKEA
jgi:hypothetical protein